MTNSLVDYPKKFVQALENVARICVVGRDEKYEI